MRCSHVLAVLTGLLVALAGVGLTAGAQTPCRRRVRHGQAATIVGTPGTDIRATNGPDVIVTNGAPSTDARDGDELICVTGYTGKDDADVYGGDGDDDIDDRRPELARRAWI